MEALGPSHACVRVACTVMCGKASRSNEHWCAEPQKVDPRGGRAARLDYLLNVAGTAAEHDAHLRQAWECFIAGRRMAVNQTWDEYDEMRCPSECLLRPLKLQPGSPSDKGRVTVGGWGLDLEGAEAADGRAATESVLNVERKNSERERSELEVDHATKC
jgi:hypothetical protein